ERLEDAWSFDILVSASGPVARKTREALAAAETIQENAGNHAERMVNRPGVAGVSRNRSQYTVEVYGKIGGAQAPPSEPAERRRGSESDPAAARARTRDGRQSLRSGVVAPSTRPRGATLWCPGCRQSLRSGVVAPSH